MAAGNQVQSVTSSQPGQGQLTSYSDQTPKLDRQKAEQLSILLRRLAIPYYSPGFTREQAEVLIADYILDLAEFAICDVEEAMRAYRRDPKSEFFPKPGPLVKFCSAARKDRVDREQNKPAKPEFAGRPHLWWMLPKTLWQHGWLEADVPAREFIKDVTGGKMRLPEGRPA